MEKIRDKLLEEDYNFFFDDKFFEGHEVDDIYEEEKKKVEEMLAKNQTKETFIDRFERDELKYKIYYSVSMKLVMLFY